MAVKRKFQVFVSSTYEDLKDERQAAVEAILRAGHIPAGMELFAANSESQLDTIRRWIDDSDVFVLIVGGRYGSIEPRSDKSYTHLEYEYAVKRKKPYFSLIASKDLLEAKIKAGGSSMTEQHDPKRLVDFRATVNQKVRGEFSNIDQLKSEIIHSLNHTIQEHKLVGWIPALGPLADASMIESATALDAAKGKWQANSSSRQEKNFKISGSVSGSDRDYKYWMFTESQRLHWVQGRLQISHGDTRWEATAFLGEEFGAAITYRILVVSDAFDAALDNYKHWSRGAAIPLPKAPSEWQEAHVGEFILQEGGVDFIS